MSRIHPLTLENPSVRVKPLFDAVQRALGSVPNMMRTMAQGPAVLEGYLSLSGALAKGTLGAKASEQIALLTAEQNGCAYCASAHTALGKLHGLSEADIEAAREGRAVTARTQAALTLAQSVIETRGHIDDATLRAARESGLSDGEIGEVVAHVALNVFTNYFNSVAATEVDFPAVRAPKTLAV